MTKTGVVTTARAPVLVQAVSVQAAAALTIEGALEGEFSPGICPSIEGSLEPVLVESPVTVVETEEEAFGTMQVADWRDAAACGYRLLLPDSGGFSVKVSEEAVVGTMLGQLSKGVRVRFTAPPAQPNVLRCATRVVLAPEAPPAPTPPLGPAKKPKLGSVRTVAMATGRRAGVCVLLVRHRWTRDGFGRLWYQLTIAAPDDRKKTERVMKEELGKCTDEELEIILGDPEALASAYVPGEWRGDGKHAGCQGPGLCPYSRAEREKVWPLARKEQESRRSPVRRSGRVGLVWTLPGGEVSASDASPEAAAVRELTEEAGIGAEMIIKTVCRQREVYDVELKKEVGPDARLQWEVANGWETVEAKWVPLSDLHNDKCIISRKDWKCLPRRNGGDRGAGDHGGSRGGRRNGSGGGQNSGRGAARGRHTGGAAASAGRSRSRGGADARCWRRGGGGGDSGGDSP